MYLLNKELPATKLRLKKALISGEIMLMEKNDKVCEEYNVVVNLESVLKLWDGFNYAPKYRNENDEGRAYLGTSYYYKFIKA